MKFLVYERRKGGDEPVADLGKLIGDLTDWLVHLRDLSKQGIVVAHWGFEGMHGSVTVFDVGSVQELEDILADSPLTADICQREIMSAASLEKSIDHLQHFMSGV